MKTLKRILAICIICIMAFGCTALAEERLITVYVDGNKIDFDVNPMLESGRTLVPMRFIFEALGATVSWDDATRTATAVKGDITIAITIDRPELIKNGQVIVLDVPARLVNDRTLVPVRAVSEGMEARVEWIDETSQVIITNPEANKSYSRSELSANDMISLKSGLDNSIHMFELDTLPAAALGNSALADKLLAKDSSALDYVSNAWNEAVVSEIKAIQDNSTDTYEFRLSGMNPEEAVKKAVLDYIAIAKQAGLSADDLFGSSEFVDMNSGAVMLLSEYMRPGTSAASYIGIVALGDGTVKYFCAHDANVDALYFVEVIYIEETSKLKANAHGTTVGKDGFISSVNNMLG